MKNLKKVIIILLIIIIAIIMCIVGMLNKKVEKENTNEYESQLNITLDEAMSLVDNKREYFAISNKISSYLQEDSDVIKNMTYSEFLDDIEIEELSEKTNKIELDEQYLTDKIYCVKKSFDFYAYYVSGVVRKVTENGMDEKCIYNIFLLDRTNMTFAIIPSEELKEDMIEKKLKEFKEIEITKNNDNEIQFTEVSDENIARRYIANYKTNMLYNPEKAYDLLDEEYRNKRFGSLEEYKTYIDENREMISKITMQKYKVDKKDDYNQYTIIDNNNNYYIIKEKAIMQYTVIQDIHTIDLDEFTQKYNSASDMEKVGMNIEKIMDALNTKDYKYVYSKLADSYKNNNFPTFESFKTYAVDMFVGVNSVEYIEYNQEGKNHLYSIIFKDIFKESVIRIEKTIIMQLKENNDFIFSFNLDNDGLIDENPD